MNTCLHLPTQDLQGWMGGGGDRGASARGFGKRRPRLTVGEASSVHHATLVDSIPAHRVTASRPIVRALRGICGKRPGSWRNEGTCRRCGGKGPCGRRDEGACNNGGSCSCDAGCGRAGLNGRALTTGGRGAPLGLAHVVASSPSHPASEAVDTQSAWRASLSGRRSRSTGNAPQSESQAQQAGK